MISNVSKKLLDRTKINRPFCVGAGCRPLQKATSFRLLTIAKGALQILLDGSILEKTKKEHSPL